MKRRRTSKAIALILSTTTIAVTFYAPGPGRRNLRFASKELRSTVCLDDRAEHVYTDESWRWSGRRPNVLAGVSVVAAKFGHDNRFRTEALQFAACLSRAGAFDLSELNVYSKLPKFLLDDDRWERHRRFLDDPEDDSARGGGYWFWKPNLILHHLRLVSDGGFVVFSDVDRMDHLNFAARLLETMVERDADLAIQQFDGPVRAILERVNTKGDIYEYFGVKGYDETTQYNADFVAVRKNPRTIEFLEDWVEGMTHYHLVSDEPSFRINHDSFEDNRHDQSMLSMLIKYKWEEPRKEKFVELADKRWGTYTFRLSEGRKGGTDDDGKQARHSSARVGARQAGNGTSASGDGYEVSAEE